MSNLNDEHLFLAARAVDDLERSRIAAENRVRSMYQVLHLGDQDQAVIRGKALVAALLVLENRWIGELEAAMRRHPLGSAWVQQIPGVGAKQAARLLATVNGDPYIRPEMKLADGTIEPERPRLLSELRSYCGYGDPKDQVRRRGHKGNWNPEAKMRTHLIAESCLRAGSYRDIYDAARAKYDGALHEDPCIRCGPAGNPAPVGSPLSAGHQHARAMRAMCKDGVLPDLWAAAKHLHESGALETPTPWWAETMAETAAVASAPMVDDEADRVFNLPDSEIKLLRGMEPKRRYATVQDGRGHQWIRGNTLWNRHQGREALSWPVLVERYGPITILGE